LPTLYIGGGSNGSLPSNFASLVAQHVYTYSPFYSNNTTVIGINSNTFANLVNTGGYSGISAAAGMGGSGGGSSSGIGGFSNGWKNFNNSVVPVTNGVSGIFGTGAQRAGTTISTAQAFNKKALAETLSNARLAKVAGRVSMAGNISTGSYAVYQLIENPTWGNA